MSAGDPPACAASDARHPQHDVTFYQTDPPLIEELVQFVGEGLLAHEAVLVVATPEHAAALRGALTSVAIDVERAEERGQLKFANADATLEAFIVGDSPNETLFHTHIGGLLRQLHAGSDRHRRVRVFGELVDLLWQAGKHDAAIKLEDLWNDMAAETGVSLMCAYRIDYRERLQPRFQSICLRHDNVL